MTNFLKRSLLIVEDSDEDFEAFRRMMQKASFSVPIYRCCDGEEALDFLYHLGEYQDATKAPRPSMIWLDLNLPGTDGREVLGQIKQDKNLQTIPVVVFTTSSNPKDLEICYRRGANSYMLKPIDLQQLEKNVRSALEYWFEIVVLPEEG